MQCPVLKPPQNGYFVRKTCGNVVNAACGIRCNSGYTLQGSSIRLCGENGVWSGGDAQCVSQYQKCFLFFTSVQQYTTCTYIHVIMPFAENPGGCQMINWLISILMIIFIHWTVKSCQELHVPANGNMRCSQERPTIDTECTFTCDPGFQLVGSQVRTCLPVAMWDGIPAYCKRKPTSFQFCNYHRYFNIMTSAGEQVCV